MKNILFFLKKNIKIILVFIFFIIYFLYAYFVSRSLPINSDIANHMLQSQDFLSGNFLMKGWIFTGITFLTTDLIFYNIAELFCKGINCNSFYLSSTLMFFSVVLTYFLVICKNKKNIISIIIFILLCTVFDFFCFVWLRVHSGALCYTFIVFLLFYNILQENEENLETDIKKKRYSFIWLMLLIFLGTFGDFLFVIECICPLLIFLLYYILQDTEKEKIINKVKIFVSIIINVILAIFADKLYFALNKSDKWSYINKKHFIGIDKLHDSFMSFIHHLLSLVSGHYWENNISNFVTYGKLINIFILLIGLIILFYVLFKFFTLKKVDNISVLLSLSAVLIFLANIFTPLNQARYAIIIPLALYGLIIRNFDDISNIFKNKKIFIGIFLVLCLFSFIDKFNTIDYKQINETTERIKDMSYFLKKHNLFNGYSSFWQSSVFTVLSEDKVKIRHLDCIRNSFYQRNWFCKDSWYSENTHFILFDLGDPDSSYFGNKYSYFDWERFNKPFNQDKVKKYFGLPDKIYEYNNYIVYVYKKNLSPFVLDTHNYISKNVLLPNQIFYYNKNVIKDNKTNNLVLSKGGFVYGPYIEMGKSKYKVTIYGKNLLSAKIDIYSKSLDIKENVNYSILNRRNNKIDFLVNFKNMKYKIKNVEFRISNNRNNIVEFDHVGVKGCVK